MRARARVYVCVFVCVFIDLFIDLNRPSSIVLQSFYSTRYF